MEKELCIENYFKEILQYKMDEMENIFGTIVCIRRNFCIFAVQSHDCKTYWKAYRFVLYR